ncbi:MAG: MBL fold metallo-hydrolase [Bryobacterales bacterium]|nr:MBL fold metallo-hydrolase [Bryobacterales bacterium]MDE0622945.1 MBL fold metallo-hydrolase [Bryobacterales bacterium]
MPALKPHGYTQGLTVQRYRPIASLVCLALLAAPGAAQSLPPGHIDPAPILDAAAAAMGVDQLRCVSFAGEGYAGMVGQNMTQNTDWPRGEPLRGYSRRIDYESGTSVERFSREPGLNPASWKYGPGWLGGTPLQRHEVQTFAVSGKHAWHIDGSETAVAAPQSAELWQLDIWMTPHGFVKAARMPGAEPTAIWRWELGESGRDGATTGGIAKVAVVSATVLGKYRVNATVRAGDLVQRIQTRVPHPVLGDMNYEHEYSQWQDLGDGILFPAGWHRHDGWDDERKVPVITGGHNSFGGMFPDMTANACEPTEVPQHVRRATVPEQRVTPTKLAEGVWLLGGGTHNSVAVEFADSVAVIEAPLDERRSLAVIDKVTELVPDKPIRYLVNTHDHYDHLGGLRTYLHVGATILTHQRNRMFYEAELLNYVPRMLEPDMVSLYPPTEISEGYTMEDIDEKYILGDGRRYLEIYYVQGLGIHVEGMLMAYLPQDRILIEADLYDPGLLPTSRARPTAAERALLNNAKQNELEPALIAPIHGDPVTWEAFLRETRQSP